MGSMPRWLGKGALPFLQWAFERLIALDEAFVIGECVLGFDDASFAELMSPRFDMVTLVVSPVLFGDPVERIRKYMILLDRTKLKWDETIIKKGHQAAFEVLFARAMRLAGTAKARPPGDGEPAHHQIGGEAGLA